MKIEIKRRDRVNIIDNQNRTTAYYYPISNKLEMDLYEGSDKYNAVVDFVSKKFQVPKSHLFITTG
jgi:hypothetical protein